MDLTLRYRGKIICAAYKGWIHPGDKVLDIGCGNAVVTAELVKHFRCDMFGCDILDYRKCGIPFKVMNSCEELPFKDKEFDACLFNDVLHHCDSHDRILAEAGRVANNILIFEMEATTLAKIADILVNQIHNRRMNIPLNLKFSRQWQDYFKKENISFEFRKIERPNIFYPFRQFAFKLESGSPGGKR